MPSSGRSFQVTTSGIAGASGLASLTPDIGAAELTPDRWAINVQNTDATNTVLIGRKGGAFGPLTPGQEYRFEGCSYRDITVNDQGNKVVLFVDGSDTLAERGAALRG
ncbi:MAG: hypothetical protein ACREEC_04275 [Thermoplasmata archaeon]